MSKRHELLRRGWPARVLLLSEVVMRSGEHHLVLLVRTSSGDFVLDNLTPRVKRVVADALSLGSRAKRRQCRAVGHRWTRRGMR
ncbi:transglutaminase-like cysteine peptidase [Bradyrhizobium sp. USDA 241]|uniref:transglutaminase-like cysteine peptidase n=1 Tax=Bradyrhizobium sp. USDA 241 TaxID=3377725 RepID=UPI003C729C37